MNESELKQLIIGVMNTSVPGIDASVLKGDDEIGPTLDIDSFDQLQIQAGLNEKLGVEIPEKEYARLKTLNQLVAYFDREINQETQDLQIRGGCPKRVGQPLSC